MNDAEIKFIADVESMGRDYERDFSKSSKEYEEEKAACQLRLKQLDKEYWRVSRELNEKYRKRVAKAANIRISQAGDDETSGIKKAAQDMDSLIGGACHDRRIFNASLVKSTIESEERKREEIAAFYEPNERNHTVVRTV